MSRSIMKAKNIKIVIKEVDNFLIKKWERFKDYKKTLDSKIIFKHRTISNNKLKLIHKYNYQSKDNFKSNSLLFKT